MSIERIGITAAIYSAVWAPARSSPEVSPAESAATWLILGGMITQEPHSA